MIDVIINDQGGLTVAHDEKALDGYSALDVERGTGRATLSGPGKSLVLGVLKPSMLEMLRADLPGQMIRLSGWAIAKISPLTVRVQA